MIFVYTILYHAPQGIKMKEAQVVVIKILQFETYATYLNLKFGYVTNVQILGLFRHSVLTAFFSVSFKVPNKYHNILS